MLRIQTAWWRTLRRYALLSLAAAVFSTAANAGNGQGTIGQLVVGRMGNQVFVQLLNPSYNQFPCGSPSVGFTYAFLLSNPGGKEMLATVLAAKASGTTVLLVGAGGCTIDSTMEDVAYVWLLQ